MRAAIKPWDLASTVISQVYKGAERIGPSVIAAVKETRGVVMAYDHDLVEALFHSTCGGKTVSSKNAFGGERAYLKEVKCAYCNDSGRYRWKKKLSLQSVGKKLMQARLTKAALTQLTRSGSQVVAKTNAGTVRIDPKRFRRALGYGSLFSDRFSARTESKQVFFEGRGFGHGVGMCQWGARGQALGERNYQEILSLYYPGASFRRLY